MAACSPDADPPTTSTTAATTTEGGQSSTTTSSGGEDSTTTTTTTAPPDVTISVPGTASESIDPAVVEEMRSELAALMVEAEQVRGIPFIATPTVVILDEAEFSQRVADLVAEDLDEGLEVFADILMNPKFDGEEMEKERELIQAGLALGFLNTLLHGIAPRSDLSHLE